MCSYSPCNAEEALHAQHIVRECATDDWSEPAKVIAFLNEIANQNTCRIGSGTLGEAFASKLP